MLYVGIDVGGTNIAAGVVDHSGRLLNKSKIKTQSTRGSDAIIYDMTELVKKVILEAGLERKDINGIGIGIPANVDAKSGIIYNCNYLDLGNSSFTSKLSKHFDLPIFIDNDGNAAAWAEHICGSAKGTDNSITITLGTGVGGGIIINNSIYNGFNGIAGEIGHTVVHMNGLPCVCGRKGCWEEYASATSLVRQAKAELAKHKESIMYEMIDGDLERMNGKIPFEAAKMGDAIGLMIVNKYVFYVAIGISNLLTILQPEVLSIGGGISNQGEYLIAPLREQVYRDAFLVDSIPKTKILRAYYGNDAGIIGAALLCKKKSD